jgi:hypothetical protein
VNRAKSERGGADERDPSALEIDPEAGQTSTCASLMVAYNEVANLGRIWFQ